jgi:hypothetical protein
MDAPERGALMLVRFIAAGLIGCSALVLVLYKVESFVHHQPMEIFPCVLKSIPAALGLVILIKAKSVAEWISDKFDQ